MPYRKRAEMVNGKKLMYVARGLIALSGARLGFGISPYDAALPAAEEIVGCKSETGGKAFLNKHYAVLSEYRKRNVKEIAAIRKAKKLKISAPVAEFKTDRERHAGVCKHVKLSKIDPNSPEFLSSFEWRAVRMMALKRHGNRCQCCGASPSTGAVLNVDHIKPRRYYPELALDVENLQILCHECNHGKGNWDSTDWRVAS